MRHEKPRVIVSRVLACLAHLALVAALYGVGWKHYDRPISGLAIATCYLLAPYTRIAVIDSGQLVPAALVVSAVFAYTRPAVAGALIGLASGWMPACLGLIPLWAGFYRTRGLWRFLGVSLGVVACATPAWAVPAAAFWARAMGARSVVDAGLLGAVATTPGGGFWSGIDPSYRLPVLIAYLAFVTIISIWPAGKNLGELIALSAAVLVASQFWYLDEGGTLVMLYLPMVLLMMFRPNLATKRPIARAQLKRARQAFSAAP